MVATSRERQAPLVLDGRGLRLDDVVAAARSELGGALSGPAWERIAAGRAVVDDFEPVVRLLRTLEPAP